MSDKKILAIVGSLRKKSFNKSLAGYASYYLVGNADMEFLDYRALPFFNEDDEFPAPAEVTRVRRAVDAADAIWIFTPEYNHAVPAVLKNLLDWLSRPLSKGDYETPLALAGKPVAISGVGGSGATADARRDVRGILDFLGADVVDTADEGFVLPAESWVSGDYAIPDEDRKRIELQADALMARVKDLGRA